MKLFTVNQAREAVSQIFKDHGLTSQTPSKPSDVHILPLTRPSIAYILNCSNIHSLLIAETRDSVALSGESDYALNKIPVARTFECPPLRLVFDGLTPGEKDTVEQLGLSAKAVSSSSAPTAKRRVEAAAIDDLI